jgi:hypothetical protein
MSSQVDAIDPVILASARYGVSDDVEEYLLRRAALARAHSERQILDAVIAARQTGISWAKIGELFGTSAQAAQQRYGAAIEQA